MAFNGKQYFQQIQNKFIPSEANETQQNQIVKSLNRYAVTLFNADRTLAINVVLHMASWNTNGTATG